MQLSEKQELVRLLSLYQSDLIKDNDANFVKPLSTREKVGKVL